MPLTKKRKFVKIVKARLPWISSLIDESNASEFDLPEVKLKYRSTSLCLACKGRGWCGKAACPLLMRVKAYIKTISLVRSNLVVGSSPPSVFVGRIGYPYVRVAPLVPPVNGDTSVYDTPELWLSKSIEEIVNFRLSLIRGNFLANVRKAGGDNKFLERTQLLAMARKSSEAEMLLKSRPKKAILLDSHVQPIGPSSELRDLRVDEGLKVDQRIYRYYDALDVKAKDAILELYSRGVLISRIQRAFSAGCFGVKIERKLVPTRWSITAVDSIISQHLRDEIVKKQPILNDYLVFEAMHADRKFLIMLLPSIWSYELIEAWYPRTTWNLDSSEIAICSDSEGYFGRKSYASIGGCYYAARLACCEYLVKIKKQAACVVISEAYPGYLLPLGVWHVRELCRKAFLSRPVKFTSLSEMLIYVSKRLRTPLKSLLCFSDVLRKFIAQRRLTDFLSKRAFANQKA